MGRAESETLNAHKQGNLKSHLVLHAAEAYNATQVNGTRVSIAGLATQFHVSESILSRHIKGGCTMGDFNALKQCLTPC